MDQSFVHFVRFKDKYNAPQLKQILEDNKIKKIFHFGRADLGFLNQHLKINVKIFLIQKLHLKFVENLRVIMDLKI